MSRFHSVVDYYVIEVEKNVGQALLVPNQFEKEVIPRSIWTSWEE
jgi:hypothetical protein